MLSFTLHVFPPQSKYKNFPKSLKMPQNRIFSLSEVLNYMSTSYST